jgi:hypothetical protein
MHAGVWMKNQRGIQNMRFQVVKIVEWQLCPEIESLRGHFNVLKFKSNMKLDLLADEPNQKITK